MLQSSMSKIDAETNCVHDYVHSRQLMLKKRDAWELKMRIKIPFSMKIQLNASFYQIWDMGCFIFIRESKQYKKARYFF